MTMVRIKGDSRDERGNSAMNLFRTSSCLRQEGVDEARWTFLIVRREEVEPPPEFIPQGNTVQNDPSHDLGALTHVLLRRPGLFFWIGNDPKPEISFAIVNL